jgi:hypothetical protein
MNRSSVAAAAGRSLVLVPVLLATWVYLPIRHIWFYSDDLMHLAEIESEPLLTFLLRPFGGHNYLVRNVVLVALYEAFGLRASLYYSALLAIHLVNVGLLFAVLRVLSGSRWIACIGAAAWGASPLVRGVLTWFCVFGQSLAAMVLLVVLLDVARHAAGRRPVSAATAAGWYLLLLAGSTCFGVGVAVALVFPLVLFLLLPTAWRQPGIRAAFLLLPPVTLGLYFGLRELYATLEPLTVEELVQPVVAAQGVRLVPAMLSQLIGFSLTEGVLGYFTVPARYPDWRTGLVVGVVAVGLVVALVQGDRELRQRLLAVGLIAVATYGMVAFGRAALYAAFKIEPARAAIVPRYHYAASLPVIILLALILQTIGQLGPLRAVRRPLVVVVVLAIGVCGYVRAGSPVTERRENCREYFTRTMEAIASVVRRAPAGQTVYLNNDSTPLFVLGPALPTYAFPGRAAVFLLAQRADALDGRPVRFIEHDVTVLAHYRGRGHSRIGRLLVAPDDVPEP